MSTLAVPTHSPPSSLRATLGSSRWLWCLLAVVFVASRDFGTAGLLDSLGDTDDATRLVQVREWLAGAGWYDLLLPRFGGPTPLLSHWSRLIDVPIAGLLLLFGLVLSSEAAELATRVVWPSLLLLLLFRLLVAEAERRAGTVAGLVALALAVTTVTGLYQFRVGRLDHHNAMILLTVGGCLALVRGADSARAAYAGGAMFGLALTIGYEPLLLIAPLVAMLGLAGAVHQSWTPAARNAIVALAATLGLGLFTSTPPALWQLAPACDALGSNLVVLAACGAAGIAIVAAYGTAWPIWLRGAVLITAAMTGAALSLGLNPDCLGGPFALVGDEARRYWLDAVLETKSIVATLAFQPVPAIVFLLTAIVAIVAAALNFRRAPSMTSAALALMTAVLLPLATTQTKFFAYGSFLAVVPLAIAIATVDPGSRLTPLAARLAGVLIICQASLTGVVTGVVRLAAPAATTGDINAVQLDGSCLTTSAIQPLGTLPHGLVVAPADLGPFIVALTHHDVLAAPYHRIDRAIVDSYRLFETPADAAGARLAQLGADYLVDCLPPDSPKVTDATSDAGAAHSLRARLASGDAINFLTPMKIDSDRSAVRVWRVERRAR